MQDPTSTPAGDVDQGDAHPLPPDPDGFPDGDAINSLEVVEPADEYAPPADADAEPADDEEGDA